MVPLRMTHPGDRVEVMKIAGAGFLAKTLGNLGISVGEELTVIKNEADSVIVRVKESRYALGTGAAGMILVAPISGAV